MRGKRAGFSHGLSLACLALLALTGCTHRNRVWIYTSLYKEVIAEMKPALERALPDIEVRWYQGGSENVASRINTELFAGRTQADLVLTSDPFWYLELKKAGRLQAYDSPAAREVPAQYADPDHFFTTVRMCVMVMGYNGEALEAAQAPTRWKELSGPAWKHKVSIGNPLESGSAFTGVAMLSRAFGWDWFADLRRNELMAAGGSGAVINRAETRERPVGIALLENFLKARNKRSPVRPVYPEEGSIAVPSPIALTADSRHPELARRVYDWFFSLEAQRAIVRGSMYSPLARIESPAGAMPWPELSRRLMKWDFQVLNEIYGERERIKSRFMEVVVK